MATWAERAEAIISGCIDGNATNPQKARIADAFVAYAPDIVASVAVDPENPTNAEKAEVFVRAVRRWGRSVLRATAETSERANHEPNVNAAGDAAEGDL